MNVYRTCRDENLISKWFECFFLYSLERSIREIVFDRFLGEFLYRIVHCILRCIRKEKCLETKWTLVRETALGYIFLDKVRNASEGKNYGLLSKSACVSQF